MIKPKALTGVIRLPDASLNFHLSFTQKEPVAEPVGEEAKIIGRILDQAFELSPEMQDILISFADDIKKATAKGGQSHE